MMLFDLETDPYETNDITEENPEIVNLLLEKLADYMFGQPIVIILVVNLFVLPHLFGLYKLGLVTDLRVLVGPNAPGDL